MFRARWLSGRVLDSGLRSCGFGASLDLEALGCVLEQDTLLNPLLSTGSTQEDPSHYDLKIVDWDVKNQNKQNKILKEYFWKKSLF